MYSLYPNNIKIDHTIPMSHIHHTSTYPNIDHTQLGQTWSTCHGQGFILGPFQNGARPLGCSHANRSQK
jgi:hypothetical protein